MKKWACIVLSLALGAPALAVDGVREINAVCAENTGCFAGDTAGYPVTITSPGSYRLTGNLIFSNANTDAIVVSSEGVSVDLNGFTISGITQCGPGPCSNTGSGRGVTTSSDAIRSLAVRNGTISHMGNAGVNAGAFAHVENVTVVSNGSWGIRVLTGSQVLRCVASLNGGSGIIGASGSLIADNTVWLTLGALPGIDLGGDGVVRGNSVTAGTGDGISAGSGTLVVGNTVSGNDGDGIESSGSSRVIGNMAFNNDGYGLRLAAQVGYSDNTIVELGPGTLTVLSGISLGGNQCNAATTCP
jgi:parallel beta-helix repeat protein